MRGGSFGSTDRMMACPNRGHAGWPPPTGWAKHRIAGRTSASNRLARHMQFTGGPAFPGADKR